MDPVPHFYVFSNPKAAPICFGFRSTILNLVEDYAMLGLIRAV